MTSDDSPVLFTARTCRWGPCGVVLPADGRRRFCSDSHKVAGHREAKRLEQVLVDLESDTPLRISIVGRRAGVEAISRVAAVRAQVQERLLDLRPPAMLPPQPTLAELCTTIVSTWPDTEVAKLVGLALSRPKVYLTDGSRTPALTRGR